MERNPYYETKVATQGSALPLTAFTITRCGVQSNNNDK